MEFVGVGPKEAGVDGVDTWSQLPPAKAAEKKAVLICLRLTQLFLSFSFSML